MLNDLFPSIIDTKFLALFKMDDATGKVASQEATSFRSTVLGDLYKEVVRRRSTRVAPRGSLHAGRSTGVAAREPLHEGVADLFLY